MICCIVAMAWCSTTVHCQTPPYYSKVEKDGFVLTKFVSDTQVNSGRTFEYHVTFSIPAGATNIVITDPLPPTVEYVSSSYYVNQTCAPGTAITPVVTLPVGNPYGGLYQFFIGAAPCGAVGSFTLVVRFPCGVTCDTTKAVNAACIRYRRGGGTISGEVCTKGITTTARARSTWTIDKRVTNMAYQGGNCPNAVNDSVIKYCITVSKAPGIEGQLNLLGATVMDVIPAGAYVKPGSGCIAATPPGSTTPTTLIWNVGNLSACLEYNSVQCCFDVVYPRALFPIGTQVINTAILSGMAGSTTGTCEKVDQSSRVCSEFKTITRGNLSKWALTNGQPGCAGAYYIQVCNNGNAPLAGIQITDALPANLVYGTPEISLPTGWSFSFTPGAGPRTFTMTSGGASLPVGACLTAKIPFTISTTAPPGVIQNCATLTATGTTATTTCYSFAVGAPQPIPCLSKSVCNKKSFYSPGDVFTYRLRIQNIGGQDLSGATITDALDPNLVYKGNVRAYSSNNYNISCGQPDNWGPVTATFPSGGPNTVKFALPTIPYNCNAVGSCGQNGSTVPFYFIEFDVKVSDSSALGSINNYFILSGGTLQASAVSNTEGIIVSANTSYWLEKGVRVPGSAQFSTTASIAAGSSLEYRLMLRIPTATPRLAALRNVSFIDMLPKDDGPASPNDDKYILTCDNRGSMFNIVHQGPSQSTSNPSPMSYYNMTQYPNIRTWQPTGAPPLLFNSGCSTTPSSTWSVVPASSSNLGFYFGPWAFTDNMPEPAWVSFKGQVETAAQPGTNACNTFVAGASVRYIVNGSSTVDAPIAETESQTVCITALPAHKSTCLCDSAYFEPFTITGLDADYRTIHVVNRQGTPITWIDIGYFDCATNTLITDPTRPVIGGGLKETRTGAPLLTLPVSSFVPPYRRVPTSGNLPSWSGSNMQDEVLFNVGFNFFGTVPPSWCMKLIIHHEDGDTCTWDMPRWTPRVPPVDPGIVVDPPLVDEHIYSVRLRFNLKNLDRDSVGFVTLSPVNPEDKIRGGSGGMLSSANDIDTSSSVRSFSQSKGTALFRVNITSTQPAPIEVFVSTREPATKPRLMVRVFDKAAGILSMDTVEVTSPVSGIIAPDETGSSERDLAINSIIPNPTSGSFVCTYTLGTGEVARLELFTTLGQSVAVLADAFQPAGQHQLQYNGAGLAEGTYYLRLSTRSRTTSAVVNIIR
jgi:uncharacterized repeat protein (TIGR01451 family)